MFVVLVQFEIRASYVQQFHEAVKQQAFNSLKLERDCHVFDVCQGNEEKTCFVLYELYSDEDAFKVHLKSEHFLAFDQLVGDWVTSKAVQLLTRTSAGTLRGGDE